MGILNGRVAVITGSGRGIGREFALSMAREGANIVINDVGVSLDGQGTDEDPAAQTVADIKALGVGAVASYESVTDYDAAGRLIQTAVDEFGTIDILVNNAEVMRVAPAGDIAFTVMPYRPSSSDQMNVMPMIAAFAAP